MKLDRTKSCSIIVFAQSTSNENGQRKLDSILIPFRVISDAEDEFTLLRMEKNVLTLNCFTKRDC